MIIKTKAQRDFFSGTGRAIGIAGASITALATTVKLIKTISTLGLDAIKSTYKTDISNMFTNISHLMYNTCRYYFGNFYSVQPAAVIAGIPLGSLQEVSHATSDRTLKYRATGGIFLAHQEGGDQTLRLVGKAWGVNRYVFLSMLDLLFLYGSPQIVDLFNHNVAAMGAAVPSQISPIYNSNTPWLHYDLFSLDEGKEEKHLTFPIITKTRIYTNMYIETYEFTESVENGMDCITYSIFFRKYRPEYPYKYAKTEDEDGNPVYWYAEDEGDEVVSSFNAMSTMTEWGFTASMLAYRFFQYLAGNSPETNVAHITSIKLNEQVYGEEKLGVAMQEAYNLDYNLAELSTEQKAELMGVD
jgi:hypothetical protein